jgi:hypothetical protein
VKLLGLELSFKPVSQQTHYLSEYDETELVRASRRVSRMPNSALLDWCDEAGTGMARYLYDFRKHGGIESITEVKEAMMALQACVLELHLRAVAEHESMQE